MADAPSLPDPPRAQPDGDADDEQVTHDVEGHMLNVPLIGVKIIEQTRPPGPKTKDIDFGSPTPANPSGRPPGD
jgi:hypothetical protein